MENIKNLDIVKQEILKNKNVKDNGRFLFCYNGSKTVNVYDKTGRSVDTYTVKDRADFIESVEEKNDELSYYPN